jgi:DNA-binding SARP family transcriptional activator
VLLPVALTARGWVELAGPDPTVATATARRALEAARRTGAADLLAEALELVAATEPDPETARSRLVEALSVWQGGGAMLAAARVEVQIGRLACADGTERSHAREAARTLLRLGITHVDRRPVRTTRSADAVCIEVLGGFVVRVGAVEVALPQWRSRQARTLVKVLVASRGRVVTRGLLCELLWPDDDPARTGHRLSVLLATVRGVLDPQRDWPPDRFVAADQQGVRLDLRHVEVDAETMIVDAAHAAEVMDAGDDGLALEILTHIDARYRGDAFDEEGSEEWAGALREQARAAWVRSVRRLATLHARTGHGSEALGLLTRLLCVDPYDEQVHHRLVLGLARAGRHGEARRAWERWAAAMREIDAPEPDAGLLARERPVLMPR